MGALAPVRVCCRRHSLSKERLKIPLEYQKIVTI